MIEYPWLTVDQVTGEVSIATAWPADESLASAHPLPVQVEIALTDYPTISDVLEFTVEFTAPL